MHISLIGMSNIGKSYWSRHIASTGEYERVDCDALVEAKLAHELVKLGYKGIHDVAKWMGQPYDAQYPDTSRKYLACERDVMLEVIERLHSKPEERLVLDTTGSVIYTGNDIGEQLRDMTRVVYLEASSNHVSRLYERYLANPKPVIWGNSFVPHGGETPHETLRRCYPQLLAYRTDRYRELAHVCIPYERHKAHGVTWDELMAEA